MSNNYGDGVSRVLDPAATQFLSVIWQEGCPPLDSEWNLVGDLAAGWDRQKILNGTPSGWFGNDINPSKDYQTDPSWSNWFKFGRQRSGDKQSIMWAAVNGWLVPVTGTKTGDPPGSPDDVDTWNKILLDPPPGSAGDARADFVFLEVWKARVSPYPSTINKPNGSAIYRYGNVEGGYSYLPDDLTDPEIGEATTERVQLQYRIRVVKGLINLGTNPDGFDQAVVKAQGAQATPPSVGGYTFTNMRGELGDPGLYRAGDGSANVLGTVDGYVYAIPICIVFRRNSILWAGEPAQNLNGGFNRNPLAVDRTGTATFSTIPTLAAQLGGLLTDLSATLVSASNIPLPATPTSTVLIKIDEELITYSSISDTSITLTGRGANGTAAAVHNAGATITVVSSRPDGLYSDQVTLTDILDLRHAVNPAGFNYTSLLRSNLDKLLKGQLKANWKKTGADPRGVYNIYQDKISTTPPVSLGITGLDAPDHIRLVFSDAAVQQPVEVICKPATFSPGPIFPLPGQQTWGLQIQVDILAQATTGVWTIGDQLRIPVSQFKNGVSPSDADQIRFLNDQPSSGTGTSYGSYQFIDSTALRDFVGEGVEVGDIIVITTGAAAGTYTITEVTTTVLAVSTVIPAATSTYVVRKGVGAIQIRVEGQATPLAPHSFSITPPNPDPTDDLVITLVSGSYPVPIPSNDLNLYITTHVQYGGGRGLSRRPDSIHSISLLNPAAQLLYQPEYTQSNTFPLRTAWTALWSKYRNDTYKSLLPVTAEAYADLGSKTVVLAPFQTILLPNPTHISVTPPLLPIPAVGVADPLGLFHNDRYVTLPRHLVPGWGEVHVPILPPNTSSTFNSGINFMLLSQEGPVSSGSSDAQHNQAFINYFVTGGANCAIFSTLNLVIPTPTPTIYSTLYNGAGYNYAGIRLFNDDPTEPGALTTARGLGRQGIELPPFYGVARLFAVYEANDYIANGSHFNIQQGTGQRNLKSSGATNLLRDNFNGSTLFIEKDLNEDSTFILNADTIDISKSPNLIPDFASGDYVIEACVFGFGRGSFDINQTFKLAVSSPPVAPALIGPNTVLPGPLFPTDTALINYSRTPYQGDAWGTVSTFSDKGFTPGPLTSANAYQLSSTELNPTGLTRPNQKPLEVLASVGFVTTLGTGRLSGDFSLSNAYDIRNVGYEDPTDPTAPYPPPSGVAPRPLVKSGALGSLANYGDLEANPEYLGCTERLPLGGLYRDKDFHGSRFSDEISSPLVYIDTAGVGSGVAGLARTTGLDQTEVLAMPASVSAGVPGDVLVMVDGEQSNYTQLLNYRTNRGGSVFVGSGDRPGGEVFATYSRLMGSGKGTRVLVGRAFLVRNAPTLVGATQVSGGDELMLAITTEVMELGTTPIEAMILIGTNGSGEGYAAADYYRIEGHPLIPNHTWYDVDPSAIQLPLGKTIAQITAPAPSSAIPTGAANSVYASDGIRNFWSNIPTLTGGTYTNLSVLNTLTLGPTSASTGGSIIFTQYAYPSIQQAIAAPGLAGMAFSITSQSSVPNSTSTYTNSGILSLGSGNVASSTPGFRGISGLVSLHSGTLDANTVGNTGEVQLSSGTNSGVGNSGVVNVNSGQASVGSSGNVTVSSGQVTGTTGNGGAVQITGGSVSNVSNPSGNAGGVTIQGGASVATSGSGGSVNLVGGPGTSSNGTVNVKLGSSVIQYASFNNTNLVLGPATASSSYGIQFSSTTTSPTIGQATGVSYGNSLTIRSQNGGAGTFSGGNLDLQAGYGTGGASNGDVLLTNANRTNVRVTMNDNSGGPFGQYLTEFGHSFYYDRYSIVFSSRVDFPMIGQQDYNGAGPTLIVRAASVSSVFIGKGGDLQLQAGNGISGNGGDIILVPGLGPGGSPGRVLFSESTTAPTISQFDQTSSASGRDLIIQAQNAAVAGWSGGDLRLRSGSGNFEGGNIDLTAANGTIGSGGDVNINSGGGASYGSISLRPGGFSGLTVTGDGTHLRVSSGTGPGLFIDSASANPPTSTVPYQGVVYISSNHLYYHNAVLGTRDLTKNLTVNYHADYTNIAASITSTSFVDVVSGWSISFSVQAGDFLEGDFFTLLDVVGGVGHLKLVLDRDSGTQVGEYEVVTTTTGNHLTLPFSFEATATGTVVITFKGMVSAGTMGVSPLYYLDLLWLKVRQIRP